MEVSGLPWWLSGKESTCQCRRCRRYRFDPWVQKILWRRKWQPTPVFLPGEFHGQRSLQATVHWVTKSQTWLKQLSTHTLDHLTCLLRNLYAAHEATVRIWHETTNWFQIGKGVPNIQGCILLPCLTTMQSTSCKTPGLMNHKLESRSDMQMILL